MGANPWWLSWFFYEDVSFDPGLSSFTIGANVKRTAECREEPARQVVIDPRLDRRQRSHAEHDSVYLRAAEGREAVSVNAVSEVEARRDGSAAVEAHAADDARLHRGELVGEMVSPSAARGLRSPGPEVFPHGHTPRLHHS